MRAIIIASNLNTGRHIAETEESKFICFEASGVQINKGDQIRGDFPSYGETRFVCFGNVCVDVNIVSKESSRQKAFEWVDINNSKA